MNEMNEATREQRVIGAFVRVADTLMNSYDIVDLLSTLIEECTDLLDIQAGGLLIAGSTGHLELVASSSEGAELVEIMQLAAGAGPCVECYTTGVAVSSPDIETDERWPEFREVALQNGFRSVHATPMRLRGTVIGTMNLLGTEPALMNARDAALAQALADVAIIGILQERNLRNPQIIVEQLHLALDTRAMIEQAKGVLSQTNSLNMAEAFATLRVHAHASQLSLRAVAEGVIDRTITIPVGNVDGRAQP